MKRRKAPAPRPKPEKRGPARGLVMGGLALLLDLEEPLVGRAGGARLVDPRGGLPAAREVARSLALGLLGAPGLRLPSPLLCALCARLGRLLGSSSGPPGARALLGLLGGLGCLLAGAPHWLASQGLFGLGPLARGPGGGL